WVWYVNEEWGLRVGHPPEFHPGEIARPISRGKKIIRREKEISIGYTKGLIIYSEEIGEDFNLTQNASLRFPGVLLDEDEWQDITVGGKKGKMGKDEGWWDTPEGFIRRQPEFYVYAAHEDRGRFFEFHYWKNYEDIALKMLDTVEFF
ncbi:MAG TPA: hypothetical protein HA346_06765, partial [Thermoplasmata archaeon]|nr:hypothetical protein [Thermoplasmata archaeon]